MSSLKLICILAFFIEERDNSRGFFINDISINKQLLITNAGRDVGSGCGWYSMTISKRIYKIYLQKVSRIKEI